MLRRLAASVFVCAFVLTTSVAYAQTGYPGFAPPATSQISIQVTPPNPEPKSAVSVSVESLSLNLDRSLVSWIVDGNEVGRGNGYRTIETTVGALGTQTKITVAVRTESDTLLTATVVLQPAAVDLLWEADSYAHPFYKGRLLPSSGSFVRAEAIPYITLANGSPVGPSAITFTWRKNDGIDETASGRGRNTAVFPAPMLFGDYILSLTAVLEGGFAVAETSTRIPSIDPGVTLYQDHPLFGPLFHEALPRTASFPDPETTFVAVPYFAAVTSPSDGTLAYDWKVNGVRIDSDPKYPNRLTINGEGSDGRARVELSLSHAWDWFLRARGTWDLLLNASTRTQSGGRGIFETGFREP